MHCRDIHQHASRPTLNANSRRASNSRPHSHCGGGVDSGIGVLGFALDYAVASVGDSVEPQADITFWSFKCHYIAWFELQIRRRQADGHVVAFEPVKV